MAAMLLQVHAQNNSMRQVYDQAESEYNTGRLDQAIDLLQSNINNFQDNLRQNAYRLISLCYLAQDSISLSENYAMLLLRENPYYTSVQDPVRFEDIINRLKSGTRATITTASNQAESLDEAPVPVTLITEDMIKMSGARNLKELLLAFVPGMINVECNEELNIAMRGIYSSGQEKILIMLNGHRLNSYCTNVARPDYSISLDKVKQIEVLRGPASSLYGGVALTSVINIITKNGAEIDGLQVKGGLGTYGVQKASILFGKRFMDVDLTIWGEIYKSDGEKYYIPKEEVKGTSPVGGNIILGGFNDRPTHNVGLDLHWKGVHLLYNTAFTKIIAPYSLSYFFSPYSYDKYLVYDGNKPGYAYMSNNIELSYSFNIRKLNLKAGIAYDNETHNMFQAVADDTPEDWEYTLTPNGAPDVAILMKEGGFQCLRFKEENFGLFLRTDYSYKFSNDHKGNITAGVHYNYFSLKDAANFEGLDFDKIIVNYDDSKNLIKGTEQSADGYIQLKHSYKDLVLNAGIRYDYKRRKNNESFHEFSPRIALIYLKPKWNVKLSYSEAFVDAPYFYRYNTLDTYYGGEDMLSEYLHSFQASVTKHHLIKGLDVEINGFYNVATNLVYRQGINYMNSGTMKNIGLELTSIYKRNKLYINGNVTWQHLVSAEDYKTSGNRIYNIPEWSANLNAYYEVIKNLRVNAGFNYYSGQISTFERPDEMWAPIISETDIPSRMVANLGATYKIKMFEISGHIYNLFNHGYEQGGTSIGPIRQQGRWAMINLTLNI
jgi:iron complex outermembrane receptor protein